MNENIRILIVDDDEKICKLFEISLGEEGIDVDYLLNGNDALEKIKSKKYDVIFLDYIMPEIDGIQLLKMIREFNKDIPVVMITGTLRDDKLEKAKEYGAHALLIKPIKTSRILDVIRDITKVKKGSRA